MTALILFIENSEHASLEPALAAAVSEDARPQISDALATRLRNLAALFAGEKYLYYSHYPNWNDAWDINLFRKRIQIGDSIGERIQTAIADAGEEHPESLLWMSGRAAVTGADQFRTAVESMNDHDVVIGADGSGNIALLGLGARAFGLGLPDALNADIIAEAARTAGLSAVRIDLPGMPQTIEDLLRLQILIE